LSVLKGKANSLLPVVFDIETTGLDPFKDELVAIAWKVGKEHPRSVCVALAGPPTEKQLLASFFSELDGLSEMCYEDDTYLLLVGYNIVGFDIPFLTTRAIVNGMVEEGAALRQLYRVDLMHLVTRYLRTDNKYMKLKDVAEALGIEVDDEVSGADVSKLLDEGNYRAILKHCISDVELAYQLMLKLKPLVEHYIEGKYDLEVVRIMC